MNFDPYSPVATLIGMVLCITPAAAFLIGCVLMLGWLADLGEPRPARTTTHMVPQGEKKPAPDPKHEDVSNPGFRHWLAGLKKNASSSVGRQL